jgi:hypothetical protein
LKMSMIYLFFRMLFMSDKEGGKRRLVNSIPAFRSSINAGLHPRETCGDQVQELRGANPENQDAAPFLISSSIFFIVLHRGSM